MAALAASSSLSGTSTGSGAFEARALDDHDIFRQFQASLVSALGRQSIFRPVWRIPAAVAWNRAAVRL